MPSDACDVCGGPVATQRCDACGLQLCGGHRACPECEAESLARFRPFEERPTLADFYLSCLRN